MPDWRRAKFQPYKCSDLCEKKMFKSNFLNKIIRKGFCWK